MQLLVDTVWNDPESGLSTVTINLQLVVNQTMKINENEIFN